MHIVIVIGQIRSGTSAVADILHHLGVPMGVSFAAPMPPVWRFEWEDTPIALTLAQHEFFRDASVRGEGLLTWFRDYLWTRGRHARDTWKTDRWGMKQPLLAVYADMLLPELSLAASRLTIIQTVRDQAAIDRSVDSVFPPGLREKALAANTTIRERLPDLPCDFRVNYDLMVVQPREWVEQIANLVGVRDAESIARAVGRVGVPSWHGSAHSSGPAHQPVVPT